MFSDEIPIPAEKSAAADAPAPEEALLHRFDIQVPRAEVEQEIDRLAVQYSQKVKLPGFRQGKVSVDVVKSTYRKALIDEAVEELIRKHAYARIEQDKLPISATPAAQKVDFPDGGDLTVKIVVELFPAVTLPDIANLEVKVPKAELQAEPYDEAIQIDRLLESRTRSEPIKEQPAGEGHMVLFALQSRVLDSNKKLSPKKENYFILKKDGQSEIPGLYDELLGKKVGERLVFQREFPLDHDKKKTWAGKKVEFTLEVKNLFELKKPELNADFLKSLDVPSEEELKKRLRQDYDHHAQHHREEVLVEHILRCLAEAVDFPVPPSLVQQELRGRISRQQALPRFASEEEKNKFRDDLIASAKRSVKVSLILDEVRKQQDIKVSEEDVSKEYQHLAQHNNLPEREIRKYYAKEENQEQLRGQLLDQKVIDFLKGKIKVSEV